MNTGNGILLIIFALLAGYLGITGKYKCFTEFMNCINGNKAEETVGYIPALLPLPPIGNITNG